MPPGRGHHHYSRLPPAFRHGLCRDPVQEAWRLYRLRYFRDDQWQLLE
ncbi:MAG TPA: hypothetical protein VES89_03430 [Candidatus Competibacteraceae bacterium]|nr:hypothetical protein [Candidatus Competibacteraceae bacterium]